MCVLASEANQDVQSFTDSEAVIWSVYFILSISYKNTCIEVIAVGTFAGPCPLYSWNGQYKLQKSSNHSYKILNKKNKVIT